MRAERGSGVHREGSDQWPGAHGDIKRLTKQMYRKLEARNQIEHSSGRRS